MAEVTEAFKPIEAMFVADNAAGGIALLLPGGIHFDISPVNTVINRCVYEDEGGLIDKTYCGRTEILKLLFKLLCDSGDTLSKAIARLYAIYDGKVLTPMPTGLKSGGCSVKDGIRRFRQQDPNRAPNTAYVWVAEVPIEFSISL